MLKSSKSQKAVVFGFALMGYLSMSYAVWYDKQHADEREQKKALARAKSRAETPPLTREEYERLVEAYKKRHPVSK
jgi:ribulose kinase